MYQVKQNAVSKPKPNPFESLPTELLDAIFDSIRDDLTSLKACSTVCHILRLVCQARIFYTANLDIFSFDSGLGPITSHRHFLEVVISSPHLASLVQELNFTSWSLCKTPYRASQEQKAAHQDVLVRILTGLPMLKILVITGRGIIDWDDLSSTLTTALFEVVRLPTLQHLDLGETNGFPASFFKSLNSLRVLSLSETHLSLDPEVGSPETMNDVKKLANNYPKRGHLQALSILPDTQLASIDALFLHTTSPIDITHLQTLTLAYVRGKMMCQILNLCGKTLKNLKVHAYLNDAGNRELDLGFQYLHSITSLTFSFYVDHDLSAARWLDLLNDLPSPEGLKHLTLMFEFNPRLISNWRQNIWTIIDNLPAHLPGLHSIRLLFWSYPGAIVDNDKILTLVRERTVRLADSDIFEAKVIPDFPRFCFG